MTVPFNMGGAFEKRDVYGTLLLQLPNIGDGQEENSWADKISSRIGLYFFGRSGAAF